jgi:Rnl2 family RNA ligase
MSNQHLQFNKYPSIENTYQTTYINKIKNYVSSDMIWDVTEKVHGANCCLITDGNTVEFAKRSSIVGDNTNFFNYKDVLLKNQSNILAAFTAVRKLLITDRIKIVQFYGELFGGCYPHKDVIKDTRYKAVQKGIYYAPHEEFYGFDIAVIFNDDNRIWLNPEHVNLIYSTSNIFYARSLFRGTLDECLQFNNIFQTYIPQWLGLPDINDNICEGVVIKPMVPQFFPNGERILLKNKNEKFTEKKGEKSHKVIVDLPDDVNNILSNISEYININRLNNIISHEGEFNMPHDFGRCMKLFSEDVLKDFTKDYIKQWNSIEKTNQKIITKEMSNKIKNIIKQYYNIN